MKSNFIYFTVLIFLIIAATCYATICKASDANSVCVNKLAKAINGSIVDCKAIKKEYSDDQLVDSCIVFNADNYRGLSDRRINVMLQYFLFCKNEDGNETIYLGFGEALIKDYTLYKRFIKIVSVLPRCQQEIVYSDMCLAIKDYGEFYCYTHHIDCPLIFDEDYENPNNQKGLEMYRQELIRIVNDPQ